MNFDPNSFDAMIAKVLTRLDKQDETLKEILTEVRKTNGRVTKLETESAVNKAKVAVVAAFVSGAVAFGAWLISILAAHP